MTWSHICSNPISDIRIFKNIEEYHIYNIYQPKQLDKNIKRIEWNCVYYSIAKLYNNEHLEFKKIILDEPIIPIPKGTIELSCGCFYNNSLQHIILANSIKILQEGSFCNCTNLGALSDLGTIVPVESPILESSILETINIPSEIVIIENNCFKNCSKLSNIKFEDYKVNQYKLLRIGNNCFDNCINLKEIIIPNSVIEIGKKCFKKCISLTNIRYVLWT